MKDVHSLIPPSYGLNSTTTSKGMTLALSNPQRLIYHSTKKPNQEKINKNSFELKYKEIFLQDVTYTFLFSKQIFTFEI